MRDTTKCVTVADRFSVAWRVALCSTLPVLIATRVHQMPAAGSALMIAATMSAPVVGVMWARRMIATASSMSFRSPIPVYVLLLFWVWFGSFWIRGETHDVLLTLGMQWERSIFWGSLADPVAYGAVTGVIALWTASWQAGSAAWDLVSLIAVIGLVLALLMSIPIGFL